MDIEEAIVPFFAHEANCGLAIAESHINDNQSFQRIIEVRVNIETHQSTVQRQVVPEQYRNSLARITASHQLAQNLDVGQCQQCFLGPDAVFHLVRRDGLNQILKTMD